MTREQAIEKIKKLQTLKEGAAKIDSDGEAKNAAAIIDKLQKEFGITMQEVYASVSETTADTYDAESSDEYEQSPSDEEDAQTLHDKNLEILWNHLVDGFCHIIDKYCELDDPVVCRQKTLHDFGVYRKKVLRNESLNKKCQKFGINLGSVVKQVRDGAVVELDKILAKKTSQFNKENNCQEQNCSSVKGGKIDSAEKRDNNSSKKDSRLEDLKGSQKTDKLFNISLTAENKFKIRAYAVICLLVSYFIVTETMGPFHNPNTFAVLFAIFASIQIVYLFGKTSSKEDDV